MKKVIFSAAFLFSFYSWAYPTTDALFQNLKNKDVTSSLVQFEFEVLDRFHSIEEVSNYKIVASFLTKGERVFYSQKIFNVTKDGTTLAQSILKPVAVLNKRETVLGQPIPALFLNLLRSIVLNDEKGMGEFLFLNGARYVSQVNQINKSKHDLLLKYKNYLELKKQTKDETIPSPLESDVVSEQEKIKEVLSENYLVEDHNVSLVRRGDQFYWRVAYDNFMAEFTNESYLLRLVNFYSSNEKWSIEVGDRILFNEVNILPKSIRIRREGSGIYEIKMTQLKTINASESTISKILSQGLKENNVDSLKKPVFLF